jgi:hypothetical protein
MDELISICCVCVCYMRPDDHARENTEVCDLTETMLRYGSLALLGLEKEMPMA